MARLDAYDILLLQEVFAPLDEGRKGRLISAARDRGFQFHVSARCRGRPMDAGLLILSRHLLTVAGEYTYTHTSGVDSLASKGVLWAQAFINGQGDCRVDLFNTHLQAVEGPDDVAANLAQVRELGGYVRRTLLSPNSGEAIAAIVAGDFNLDGRTSAADGTPHARYYEGLAALALTDEELTLQDLVLQNSGNVPVTWPDLVPGSSASRLVTYDGSRGQGLDYVFFVSRNASGGPPNVSAVPGSAAVDEMRATGQAFVTMSDHFAVTFDMRCPVGVQDAPG